MVRSIYFREILFCSLVGVSISEEVHITPRQEGGGSLGAIPPCVASAEGTLFTETSGVLPTADCTGVPEIVTGAVGSTGGGVTGDAPPPPSITVSLTSVSSTSVSQSPAAISSTGSPQGPVLAAPLPSFITIPAAASGSSERFSQTIFPDLATLTTTETVTTGIAQPDSRGGTTTVKGPIVVGPGGIGFIGETGALPTGVSIDGNGNTPGGSNNNNPGGDTNIPGKNNNSNNNDANNYSPTRSPQQESTASASSTKACVLTEVACTQTCTISSISGSSAPITSCGSPGLCRRQGGGSGCTFTTGTTTSTSFTTASASALICKAGSCTGALCGTAAQNIAPAITTNSPSDQIPSLANLPNPVSNRRHRRITKADKIIKRVLDADPEDPTSIRQLDFTDPNSLYKVTSERSSKEQWYTNAQKVVKSQGPGNVIFQVGENQQEGGSSSTKFNYADLRQNAITTGSGPSWGCTSVLVYSERGVWIAHFWEQEQMQADDFNGKVLNFIRSGEPGRFEGLRDVVPSLFSGPSPGEEEGEIVEVPVFSGAIIFTPSFRKGSTPPLGSQMTDPIYSNQVSQIKTVLVNQIPGFTFANMNQKIKVATYQPVGTHAEQVFNPWLGLLTFEYVPQHISNDNNACEVLRAIRIHIQDEIQSIISWNWPVPSPANPNAAGPSKLKNKRQGACPVNLPQVLSAQGDGTAEPSSFFDISTPVRGVTGVTSQFRPATASASISPSASPTPPVGSPATMNGPGLCSNWKISPNGERVGTNCDGDPNKTVTVTVTAGKRAVKTAF